jgi:hypothetical protein
MQIDFKALEQALAPIEKIGQGELIFDAGDTPITLRILLPSEELEIQRYAGQVFVGKEGEEDSSTAVEYLDRFRTATLSYAIVEVGGQDFRDVEFVETGEYLDNGQPIKIAKHKALRQLIPRWSRALLVRCFHKYSELLNTVEANAEKAIDFTPSDHDAEIERLESRLKELRATKEREQQSNEEAFSARVRAVAAASGPTEIVPQTPPADPDEPEINPEQALPAAVRRAGPISPASAPPPAAVRPPAPQPQAPAHRPAPPVADSSFINPDDDEGLNAALDMEHRRIAEMRRRHLEGQAPVSDGSALEAIHPQTAGRRPPHIDARMAEEDIGVLDASARQAREVGEIDGKPVFAMPSQELGTPSHKQPGRPVVNQTPEAGGSKNPRFIKPTRP